MFWQPFNHIALPGNHRRQAAFLAGASKE